jgi:predicted N-formylglutamate amidohydrolase
MNELYPPLIERGEAAAGAMNVVIVCEHASNTIPRQFNDLGLDSAARQSHISWDPGALGVAQEMRRLLDADLVAGSVSRLLYDCNRPPEAPSAMPAVSEIFEISGNKNLSEADRAARTAAIYMPFRTVLAEILDQRREGILVTVHSFTPIYHGVHRTCEIGILHDADARLADAMLDAVPGDSPFGVERNVPYSANDGVTHTLKTLAMTRGWPNVMLEIRNDLIEAKSQQVNMARYLVSLLSAAVFKLKEARDV